MPRYVYFLVDDDTGDKTAYPLMRGAKLDALKVQNGRILRGSVTDSLVGRDLYAALLNGDGIEDLIESATVKAGRLSQPQETGEESED